MSTLEAVVLGGGVGRRFSDLPNANHAPSPFLPKQFHSLDDRPVLIHTLESLSHLEGLQRFVVVAPEPYLKLTESLLIQFFGKLQIGNAPILLVPGGERRQDSSRLAIEAIERSGQIPDRVLIHDACRPCLSSSLLERVQTAVDNRSYAAWNPVVPIVETLKKIENNQVTETVDRNELHRVQTPQVFEYSVIRSLVGRARAATDLHFTDDASLCEYYGIPVGVFEGDVSNIKLTYSFEIPSLARLLKENKDQPLCASEPATTFTESSPH